MSDYLDPHNEELLKDFFAEAYQQVELMEQNLLVLEQDPGNSEAVDEIFRAAHTLKGGAGTVQMEELAEFTHALEDALDEIRSGTVKVSSEIVDLLLSSLDVLKAMLGAREAGDVYREDVSALLERLKALQGAGAHPPAEPPASGKKAGSSRKGAPSRGKAASTGGESLSEEEIRELFEAAPSRHTVYRVQVTFDESNVMNTVGGIQGFALLKDLGAVLRTDPPFEKLYEDEFFPVVVYYVASSLSEEELLSRIVFPSDVAKDVKVERVSLPEEGEEAQGRGGEPEGVEEGAESGGEEVGPVPAEEEEGPLPELPKKAPAAPVREKSVATSILRVDSGRVDALLNLVSEAVINKATFNQISVQFGETFTQFQTLQSLFGEKLRGLMDVIPELARMMVEQDVSEKQVRRMLQEQYGELFEMFDPVEASFKGILNKYREATQQLNRITGEMQEAVMRIRMVPISQIFARFPRLVRDLSRSLKKKINLIIEGQETELDKSVIEDLLDPLIHCVRNSVDHGIEGPGERKKAGKPEEGTIVLRARNEGNLIVIEIIDDGRGIDVEAVRKRAVERGLIHPNKILSQVEAFNLIFEPGFSTARSVTDLSGRGVGLDVVKRQIEKLNGSISVWSEQGKGTRFTIKLPLTLAIIQGLLVQVGGERYAIPITSVVDCHRIRPSDIRYIDGYEVFDVREEVVSLLRLNRLFKIPTDEEKEYFFVVIVGSGERKMGIVVDGILGEEDVVIKPLRDHFVNTPGIAGANITGEGTVSLIIDVPQLLELGLKEEREARKKRDTSIL
ncbi:CheA signal transduction histidine kinase [Spirochaeta thermophila DSM 6578]|uniref:Chemotaxis protein CheA n=1 Tax=Winmispira thermophila (strain ATCC 700085 / DSM 6578 / Z-1203) TaxID=869211 RepID=G0GCI7_WINT7|nr:chemotaxis protein CheA [Spirochaeta thermophila]AEJ62053.1 CheA signal transduction histidine kinase [Spirochaeta thermophila DSM 6578]